MKTKIIILFSLVAAGMLIFNGCDQEAIDPQKTVIIGDQEWMVYNLYTDTFSNGELIPEAQTVGEWIEAAADQRPAWCNNFNPLDESTFGKLYNWYALTDPRGLAPEGWHVPSDAEWTRLTNVLGGDSIAGGKMKATNLWRDINVGATNSSGFTAVPGTSRDEQGLTYAFDASTALFWSTTETGQGIVLRSLVSYSGQITREFYQGKGAGIAVRCLKGISGPPTVIIGDQEWMAKNLNVAAFRNGEPIPQAITDEEWSLAAAEEKPAWCYYQNIDANGEKYGKLYNWYAVHDPRGLAPQGWHVPNENEWISLSDYLGGEAIAGGALKSTSGWSSPNEGATNSSGFTGLPGEFRNQDGLFYTSIEVGLFWSSTQTDAQTSRLRGLSVNNGILAHYSFNKGGGVSVRCIRD